WRLRDGDHPLPVQIQHSGRNVPGIDLLIQQRSDEDGRHVARRLGQAVIDGAHLRLPNRSEPGINECQAPDYGDPNPGKEQHELAGFLANFPLLDTRVSRISGGLPLRGGRVGYGGESRLDVERITISERRTGPGDLVASLRRWL